MLWNEIFCLYVWCLVYGPYNMYYTKRKTLIEVFAFCHISHNSTSTSHDVLVLFCWPCNRDCFLLFFRLCSRLLFSLSLFIPFFLLNKSEQYLLQRFIAMFSFSSITYFLTLILLLANRIQVIVFTSLILFVFFEFKLSLFVRQLHGNCGDVRMHVMWCSFCFLT